MTGADWIKALVPVSVAIITSFAAAWQADRGDVARTQFIETGTANCQDINELKDALRSILVAAGRDGSQDPNFIVDSIEKLQRSDCSARVGE